MFLLTLLAYALLRSQEGRHSIDDAESASRPQEAQEVQDLAKLVVLTVDGFGFPRPGVELALVAVGNLNPAPSENVRTNRLGICVLPSTLDPLQVRATGYASVQYSSSTPPAWPQAAAGFQLVVVRTGIGGRIIFAPDPQSKDFFLWGRVQVEEVAERAEPLFEYNARAVFLRGMSSSIVIQNVPLNKQWRVRTALGENMALTGRDGTALDGCVHAGPTSHATDATIPIAFAEGPYLDPIELTTEGEPLHAGQLFSIKVPHSSKQPVVRPLSNEKTITLPVAQPQRDFYKGVVECGCTYTVRSLTGTPPLRIEIPAFVSQNRSYRLQAEQARPISLQVRSNEGERIGWAWANEYFGTVDPIGDQTHEPRGQLSVTSDGRGLASAESLTLEIHADGYVTRKVALDRGVISHELIATLPRVGRIVGLRHLAATLTKRCPGLEYLLRIEGGGEVCTVSIALMETNFSRKSSVQAYEYDFERDEMKLDPGRYRCSIVAGNQDVVYPLEFTMSPGMRIDLHGLRDTILVSPVQIEVLVDPDSPAPFGILGITRCDTGDQELRWRFHKTIASPGFHTLWTDVPKFDVFLESGLYGLQVQHGLQDGDRFMIQDAVLMEVDGAVDAEQLERCCASFGSSVLDGGWHHAGTGLSIRELPDSGHASLSQWFSLTRVRGGRTVLPVVPGRCYEVAFVMFPDLSNWLDEPVRPLKELEYPLKTVVDVPSTGVVPRVFLDLDPCKVAAWITESLKQAGLPRR